MGFTTDIYCMKPFIQAPCLGDWGYMGDLDFDRDNTSKTSFFSMYKGFDAIDLVTDELESLYQFFVKYKASPIYVVSGDYVLRFNDGKDPQRIDILDDWMPEGFTDDDFENVPIFEFDTSSYTEAFYELESEDTGDLFTSEDAYPFRPFIEKPLTADQINMAKDRLFDLENFEILSYKVWPIYDPSEDLGDIKDFFERNYGKKILARLVDSPSRSKKIKSIKSEKVDNLPDETPKEEILAPHNLEDKNFIFSEKNFIGTQTLVLGTTQHQLELQKYDYGNSRGLLTRISDGTVMADIKQRYHDELAYAEINHPNGNIYIVAPDWSNGTYHVINLTTGVTTLCTPEGDLKHLNWAGLHVSPDSLLIAVTALDENEKYYFNVDAVCFYDFSNPDSLPLKMIDRIDCVSGMEDEIMGWEHNEFVCKIRRAFRKSNGASINTVSKNDAEKLEKDDIVLEYEMVRWKRPVV